MIVHAYTVYAKRNILFCILFVYSILYIHIYTYTLHIYVYIYIYIHIRCIYIGFLFFKTITKTFLPVLSNLGIKEWM